MPLYEYRCNKCQYVFEISLRMEEKDKICLKCPKCKSEDLGQILSTGGILKHGRSKTPECSGCCGKCKI